MQTIIEILKIILIFIQFIYLIQINGIITSHQKLKINSYTVSKKSDYLKI